MVASQSVRPHHTLWGDAFVRLRRNKLALAGGAFVLLLGAGAIFAPWITPYGFAQQNYDAIMQAPSASHLLGTDELGRDVLSRLLFGARTSLAVGIFTQFIVLAIGLPIGAVAGYSGGRVDNLLMRFVDVMYGFPDILLIILLRSIFGGSIYMIFLAIGLVAWVNIARLVRGQVLSLKERGLRQRRPVDGRGRGVHHHAASAAKLAGTGYRRRHLQHPTGDLHRSGPELHRHRSKASNTQLGGDDS